MKVSLCIPAYNQAEIIYETIMSCVAQDYQNKEIVVIDDCSTDSTAYVASLFKNVRLIENEKNIGLPANFRKCVAETDGDILIFMSGDDMFTSPHVVSDIVKIFEDNPDVGIVDRDYYQYMDGKEGAVANVQEMNIIISSVNASGIGFRRSAMAEISDRIYIEIPSMVKEMIKRWRWVKMDYDTVAVRLHKNNTATKKSYYNESVIQNWYDLMGRDCPILWDFMGNYISLKNRTGLKNLLKEIKINIKLEPRVLFHPAFYFFTTLTVLTPSWILIRLSDFYRDRISRLFCKIKERK